jgi:hypothetical protein
VTTAQPTRTRRPSQGPGSRASPAVSPTAGAGGSRPASARRRLGTLRSPSQGEVATGHRRLNPELPHHITAANQTTGAGGPRPAPAQRRLGTHRSPSRGGEATRQRRPYLGLPRHPAVDQTTGSGRRRAVSDPQSAGLRPQPGGAATRIHNGHA